MKIFVIRNEEDKTRKNLAYLIYYEKDKRFYIELPDDADIWETPLILSSRLKRGEKTINAYWSKIWVQQRIIPQDRQNLGRILKDNGLDSYDEFKLLAMTDGRCAQDYYYLTPISEKNLPAYIIKRNTIKVKDVFPLKNYTLLISFYDDSVRKCKLEDLVGSDRHFAPVLNNEKIFLSVKVETGGYGICWGESESLCIPRETLHRAGKKIPLTSSELQSMISDHIIDSAQAAEELGCSKQNIDDLVRRGKLTAVKEGQRYRLFMKSDIEQRRWK